MKRKQEKGRIRNKHYPGKTRKIETMLEAETQRYPKVHLRAIFENNV